MRRTVLIVPDWLGSEALRQKLPSLQAMAEMGHIFKIAPLPPVETPEALWLGLGPNDGQLRQGPLTVAALGADPPDRSTHFHVTPMSFEDGAAREIQFELSESEQRALTEAAKRLDTRSLTFVAGQGLDHGLVWEGLGELQTAGLAAVGGQPIRKHLPEGDADLILRRFIDDSINLLSELPFNEERVGEGLPPVNLLWPWGNGVRKPVPNLVLRRGERARVLSGSLRLAGLARLAAYRHGDRQAFGAGVKTRLEWIAGEAITDDPVVIVLEGPGELQRQDQIEELFWLTDRIDALLLEPLFELALKETARITLLAPKSSANESVETGLGLTFQTRDAGDNAIPFDERAAEEKTLPTEDCWSAVERGLLLARPLA